MTSDNSFELNQDNRLLAVSYRNDNYKVIQGLSDNGKCIVFFSGNGLYFPNTEESFRKTIMYRDRYEWASVSSIICDYVSRIILVRDVRKSWYADGINSTYNTLEKTVDFLKTLCEGMELYYFGNSAGGYMAMLARMMMGAKCIYNWGGQTDLFHRDICRTETDFLRTAAEDQEKMLLRIRHKMGKIKRKMTGQ